MKHVGPGEGKTTYAWKRRNAVTALGKRRDGGRTERSMEGKPEKTKPLGSKKKTGPRTVTKKKKTTAHGRA